MDGTEVNKRRSARILVALLALLMGSGPAWSGCLRAGAEATGASHAGHAEHAAHAAHAAHADPAHCGGLAAEHPGCTQIGPLCLADHPPLAAGLVPDKSPAGADQQAPDLLPPPAVPARGLAFATAQFRPPPRALGVLPPLPVTLVQLRVLLLD